MPYRTLLLEICRLREVPIITFAKKLDRKGRAPSNLADEIEQARALEVTPASWDIRVRGFFPKGVHLGRRRGREMGRELWPPDKAETTMVRLPLSHLVREDPWRNCSER
jgi:peptide subunit release factor RF-3